MAQDVSERLAITYQFPNFLQIHLRTKTVELRSRLRRGLRQLMPSKVAGADAGPAGITVQLEAQAEHFRQHHWGYIDPFWEPGFHKKMIEHWPPDRFFNPVRYVTKSYDTGFVWTIGQQDPEHLHLFPAYKAAYDHLRSPEFARRVEAIADDGVRRECYRIILTRSYWGSSIIPHIDSNNMPGTMNFVIFVDGTGGPRGGGLGLWADNEFKRPIFVPQSLRNSAVFYDMSESFYHGFEPMRFGAFRWSLNATFESRNPPRP